MNMVNTPNPSTTPAQTSVSSHTSMQFDLGTKTVTDLNKPAPTVKLPHKTSMSITVMPKRSKV